jgi:hypothetical protein
VILFALFNPLASAVVRKPQPANSEDVQSETEFTVNREGSPNRAEEVSPNEHKLTLKEKAAFQLKEFLAMFFYIWVLSALADMHETIILAQTHLNYPAQGFAIINALILGKIMLIGEDLHLGNRFRDKALIYSILYKSLIFTVFLAGFHILEEVIVGVFRGTPISETLPAMGAGSLKGLMCRTGIVFIALIPFFAFREIGRVIGKGELWSLLLARGTRVYTLQSRPQ